MKNCWPFFDIKNPVAGLLLLGVLTCTEVLGQVHIEPANPRICLGDSVLLRVIGDDPGNLPTFFAWMPTDSLSNPNEANTYAYPTDTITYFVETNAGGAEVTVYVIPPPAVSFTGLEQTYYCPNDPPVTLTGTPAGGTYFTNAPSGLVDSTLFPAQVPPGTYDMFYAVMYGDTSMCTDTVSQFFVVGEFADTVFTGLAASYCSNSGLVTLTPNQFGGTFSANTPTNPFTDNVLDLSLVPMGIPITVTYTITNGDPPCTASSSQTFIVNEVPFLSIEGLPSTYICENDAPYTLTVNPPGGTLFTNAPSGLSGNVLTPSQVPPNNFYTLFYAFETPEGCVDTVTREFYVIEVPAVSFSGLDASYCGASGVITLTGSPLGGSFTSNIPGLTLVGDVVNIDLALVPTNTPFEVIYNFSTASDPPCATADTQTFIINEVPFLSIEGLPSTFICENDAPYTLTVNPPGGTLFTNAPSGLSGNVLTPSQVPPNSFYTLFYAFETPEGCVDTVTREFYVIEVPDVSFSGLDASYCGASGVITLTGSPLGGNFTSNIPGLTLVGDVVNIDLALVPTNTPFEFIYNFSTASDPPCATADTQTFIINEVPFLSIEGLPSTYICENDAPYTLTVNPPGGTLFTNAPSGLSGNVLTPSQVPPNNFYTLFYAFETPEGCVDTVTREFYVIEVPDVSFSGLDASYCGASGVITLTGSPLGGSFTSNIPGLTLVGDVVNIDLALVPTNTPFEVIYNFSTASDPPCATADTQTFIINEVPFLSIEGLPSTYICENDAPYTLTVNPPGGTLFTNAPSGLSGNVLTPSQVPPNNFYTLFYAFETPEGCVDTVTREFYVIEVPAVSFSGLDASYCGASGVITLTGSPLGGNFTSNIPGLTLVGDVVNIDLALVPTNTPFEVIYNFSTASDPPCATADTQTFIINEVPFLSIEGLPSTFICENDAPYTLTVNPPGGTLFTDAPSGLSGNVLTPSQVPPNNFYTLFYAYETPEGCVDTVTREFYVIEVPAVSFSGLDASYCQNDGIVTLTGVPAGGSFSTNIPGISFTGDVVDLDISQVPVNTVYDIIYTFNTASDPSCIAADTQQFVVNTLPTVSFTGLPATVCANAAPFTLTGSPAGGTFSTSAPSGGLVGNTIFPQNIPAGSEYSVTYTYTDANGCTNSTNQSFFVSPLPTVDAGTYAPVCVNGPLVNLVGSPAGGTFSGTGVVGTTFNPSFGTQTVTYTFTDANGCTNSDQTTITVNPLPTVNAGTYPQLCADAAPITLSGSPSGGVFSGVGVSGTTFDPGFGTQTITYTYTDANGCTNSASTTITVVPLPTVSFTGLPTLVCANAAPFTLTGSPAGGTFSTSAPSGGLVGNTIFPQNIPAGSEYSVTYTYTDANGCTNSTNQSFFVSPLPTVDAGTYAPVCVNGPLVNLVGTPAGGTFSGTGVVGTTFNPSFGTQTITYTFTDANGCTNSDQVTITVNPLPTVNAGTYPQLCENSAPITLTGSPSGGVFSGVGVSGTTFDPGFGTQTITYTYTDANGCTNSASTTITVVPLPTVSFTGLPTLVCANAAPFTLTGSPAGGTFSTSAPSGGLVGNTIFPQNIPAGSEYSVTYTYTDANGCTNSTNQSFLVAPLPTVDAGTYAPVCVNGPLVNLVGTPAGGTFSGTGVVGTTFNPSFGTQTITYTFTDANGCTNSDQTIITVNPLPTVDGGTYAPVCVDAPNVPLVGSPAGGTFSGTGIVGNSFDPSVGTQTLTYTYTDANGCTNSDNFTIIVQPLPVVDAGTYDPVCANAPFVPLAGSPAGGTFSGIGVSGNFFDPSFGTQNITYTYTDGNGCTNSAEITIVVYPLPVVDAGTYAAVCANGPLVNLVGSPAGGVFSGTGVSGTTFNPSFGTQTITYTFTDANGCTNSDQTTITVNPLPTVDGGTYAPVCVDAPNVPLVGSPAGGTFSGTGIVGNSFDPSVGTQTLTYTYTDANGCTNSDNFTIIVQPLPVVDAGTYDPVCANAPFVPLAGSPAGGTFSGIGVSGDFFDPSFGTQNITYTYTDGNGCTNSAEITIVVYPLPTVDAGIYAAVCANGPLVNLVGSPVGGVFSGVGVSGTTFNPSFGTQTITYTFTDANGCTNSDQATITVNPLPTVDGGTYASVCVDAPNVTLTGSPAGGTFSGTGIVGNSFDPSVGTQTLTYTYTDANGCTNSDNFTIIVQPLPVVDAGTYDPVCANAPFVPLAGSPAGGTFSGIGVSGNFFDPSFGTQNITYTYTDGNGCTNSAEITITVYPLPVVDAGTYAAVCANGPLVNLVGSPAGGTFSGVGVSGTTFNPVVGTQTITYTFTDANGCTNSDQTTITVNPLPTVDAGIYANICENAANIPLLGSPAGGVFSGVGVIGNTFDPSVGTQIITYTYTDANGCTNTDQATITVISIPLVNAGTYPIVCVNAPLLSLSGTPSGGIFTGNGVVGATFNPTVGTQTITYTVTTADGCVVSDQVVITVSPLPAVDASTVSTVCQDATPVALSGTPAGGIYTGVGVVNNTFDPAAGTQTITYTYTDANGCSNSDQTIITVVPPPTVEAGNYPAVCANDGNLLLSGVPTGGVFSGIGVSGNTFDPSVGTQTITYTYIDNNGCDGVAQTVITVKPVPVVEAGSYAVLCQNASPISLSGSPFGGAFSGVGVTNNTFDPSLGTQVVTYTYTANGCTNTDETQIVVNSLPAVFPGTYAPACIDANEIGLSGTPAGGIFSGVGVTGSLFDPSVGTQVIAYTVTDANGCTNSAQTEMVVYPLPTVDAGTYAPSCLGGNAIPLVGIPAGGVFSGIGVTGNTFDPAQGTQTILYTYADGNGCTNTANATIEVNAALNVNFTGLNSVYCAAGPSVVLTGIPAGGLFTTTAPGGLDGTVFSPQFIPAGSYTLTYTYEDGNGCSGTTSQNVTINALPAVQMTGLDASYCVSAASVVLTGAPAGGVFSSTAPVGFSGNQLNPAAVPTGNAYTITYAYTDANGCTDSIVQPFIVNALPTVDAGSYAPICQNATPITLQGAPGGGVFSGNNVTNGIFDPSQGTQTVVYTYTDANNCTNTASAQILVNSLPVVTINGLAAQYCNNDAAVLVSGSPVGGSYTSPQVSSFVPTGTDVTFIPSSLASGTIATLNYTYQDAQGCTVSVNGQTQINAAPEPLLADTLVTCGESGTISLQPVVVGETYLWSNGATTSSITVTEETTYTVTVTAANGCSERATATIFIQSGEQFVSNLLVSGLACTGDTLHFFDISAVLVGVDSYFWQFGDGSTSNERDPVHVYADPGIYNVTLTATSDECENLSLAKPVQIATCRTLPPGDVFDYVEVYPNPAPGAFNLDISLTEPKDVLVSLNDFNGRVLQTTVLRQQPWYQIPFQNLAPGVYFVHVQSEINAVVLKVIVL